MTKTLAEQVNEQFLKFASASHCEALCETFKPIIQDMVGQMKYVRVPTYSVVVRYDHHSPEAQMHMYCIEVTIENEWTMDDLGQFVSALEEFCSYEKKRPVVNGHSYDIGDGDDWGAVTYKDGKFHIWLRTWLDQD